MTATLAPQLWPASSPARGSGWRFASVQHSPTRWRFDLRRSLSLTPLELLQAYAMVCLLTLAVASGFWWHGVRAVGLFAGIELVAVGFALRVFARHASDRETIDLSGRELAVQQYRGGEVERRSFRPQWVRVEPASGVGSLVELSGEGHAVRVGRHVRPELRAELADELRRALRLVRAGGHRD